MNNKMQEVFAYMIRANENEKSRNKLFIYSIISYSLNFIHELSIIYTGAALLFALLALYKNIKAHISITKITKETNK